MEITQVESFIGESIRKLWQHPGFVKWRDSEALNPGDVVLINNSFVFRDVKTNKAKDFLSLTIRDQSREPDISIVRGVRFNLDFKRMSAKSTNIPDKGPLGTRIDPQIDGLGHLVFLLIGEIQDTEVVEVPLNHGQFSQAVWDPTISEPARVEPDRIVVRRTDDEHQVWNAIARQFTTQSSEIPADLRQAVGVALDRLQDKAVAHVRLPQPGETPPYGITDAILAVLQEQRDEYAKACSKIDGNASNSPSSLNDVLRLAYNFASDATGYLRLIVSICDLKPIVLWGTIAEHYALSEAFHALPWERSRLKPSLRNYQQSISDARNSAFHNLFPFRKSLRVSFPEAALGAPELQIFSEYAKKSNNQLTYRDKELVDVLLGFTRARERRLPTTFWQKNLELMDATIELFERSNEFVKVLAAARAH